VVALDVQRVPQFSLVGQPGGEWREDNSSNDDCTEIRAGSCGALQVPAWPEVLNGREFPYSTAVVIEQTCKDDKGKDRLMRVTSRRGNTTKKVPKVAEEVP
jgi:hypothetical protein